MNYAEEIGLDVKINIKFYNDWFWHSKLKGCIHIQTHRQVGDFIILFFLSKERIMIKSKRMRWTWYLARMKNRNACRILAVKPEEKRQLARLSPWWVHNIIMDLRVRLVWTRLTWLGIWIKGGIL
jgi:hypothetical protein